MRPDTTMRLSVVAALALCAPSLLAFSAGALSFEVLAVRLVLALVLARIAIGGLDRLVRGYVPATDERPRERPPERTDPD